VLFAPLAAPARLATLQTSELAALAFCIANMLIAYGTFAEALVHLEASRVSALLAIAPLTTLAALRITDVLLPGIVAPEPITGVAVSGAALVVAGSLTAALGRRADAVGSDSGPRRVA
jgi:drug/metabolite transporter (DMT)-like permease